MSPFYDKSLNPLLLSESAAGPSQSDSDAPSQRLWRPDSSTPESFENECKERQRKHFWLAQRVRRVLFVGALALGLGLLFLWLFLLLTDDAPSQMPNNINSTSSSLFVNKGTLAASKGSDESEKRRKAHQQKLPQRHRVLLVHVTAPSTTPATRKAEMMDKGTRETTRTTPKMASPTATYVDIMQMPKWWDNGKEGREKTQIVVAQMERIGGTGKVTTETPTTSTAPKTTNIPKTIWTTKAPTTTMTMNLMRTTIAQITPTTERRKSEENKEEEEEEDNLLFWRRGYSAKHSSKATVPFQEKPSTEGIPPKRLLTTTTVSTTATKESLTVKQMQEGHDTMRPTIQFGPMNAMEVAGTARDQQLKKEEQHKDELNEIIASLEKENSFSPVEIPFPLETPRIPIPEPVWRRPPPDEAALPTRPPKMPSSAVVVDAHITNEQKTHSKATLERKRREAPVIVTALLDIGRGDWPRFTRHFDQYLGYLANIVLRLQNRIIIYCDPLVTSYLLSLRDRIAWERIQVVEMPLQELPYYKYRDEIEEIMRWEQKHWHGDWDAQMRTHPETIYPDYDILVNSKPYFLLNATSVSRFSKSTKNEQQFFVWLDAGYGHGSASEIPYGVWSPVLKADKITLVQLTPKIDRVERYTLDKVYRKQKSVVSGGFLAGSAEAIRRFHTFFHISFLEMLDEKMVDDDQTTLLVTIQKYQSDFNIVFGGWFDAFRLLPSQ